MPARTRWVGLVLALVACTRDRAPEPTPRPAASPTAPLVVAAALERPRPHGPSFDGGVTEFIHEDFEHLYPIFCIRHSMPLGEKAALWMSRYYGKWVRWTGKIRSFTPQGVTLQMRPFSVVDISVWIEADQVAQVRRDHKRGDRITFIARLDSYDDVFQKLYLTHGSVLSEADAPHAPPGDGGL